MTVDLAIVGAGPAGMAAAALAAELGLDTVLIDEQDGPGGQIYRGIERLPGEADRRSSLGRDYLAGQPIASSGSITGRRRRFGISTPRGRCG